MLSLTFFILGSQMFGWCLRRKTFNQAETGADMNQKHSFPNVKSEKAYEGTVMIYRHKTKPNSLIESETASKIESVH